MPHFHLQNNGDILSGLSRPISVMSRKAACKAGGSQRMHGSMGYKLPPLPFEQKKKQKTDTFPVLFSRVPYDTI